MSNSQYGAACLCNSSPCTSLTCNTTLNLNQCPGDAIDDNNNCYDPPFTCPAYCGICSDEETCTTCITGYYLLTETGKCTEKCPIG